MGVILCKTANQAGDSGVGGLNRLTFCYPLSPAGDDCPLKVLVRIARTQKGLDDAEDSQDAFFLLFDDEFIACALPTSAGIHVGRNPEHLIEGATDAGGRDDLQKLRPRVGLPYPIQLTSVASQQKYSG